MITIKTTPHLYGITLSGDYQDLMALYDSIRHYLDFYYSNNSEFYPYHEYEYLLSLNYDIRHAYMGTRNIEYKENNADNVGRLEESIYDVSDTRKRTFSEVRKHHTYGNLYFSVEILYPLVFHYLYALDNIVNDEPLSEWFENQDPENPIQYNRITADYDRKQIMLFLSLIWKNIEELFGEKAALDVLYYFENSEPGYIAHSLYTDALLHYQMAHFDKFSNHEKMQFLLASFYEIIGSEDLMDPEYKEFSQNFTDYESAIEGIKKSGPIPFPDKESMYSKLDQYLPDGEKLYWSTFDSFLEETYGLADDEDPVW